MTINASISLLWIQKVTPMKFGNTNYENMSNASLILKWHLALKKNIYEEKLFYLYGWNDFEMCMAVEYIV